ncbi:MAG: hypothetical protein ACRC51_08840 [Cetobacterium sp.]
MKRILMLVLGIVQLSVTAYSDIRLKIHEPIRFENVNTKAVGDLVIGQGSIEVITDNLEVDRNKKFIFKFPKKGLMTNKKRWIQIDEYMMEDSDKTFKVDREKKIVKIYAVIERRKLNDQLISAEELEGEYIGYVPIIVEQYGKPITKIKKEG